MNYSYSAGQTTASNTTGNSTIFGTASIAGSSKVTGLNQTCAGANCSGLNAAAFSYDTSGNVTSSTDFNGNITHYTYNARNLEASRTEAYGTSYQRTITTDWNPDFRLPSVITIPVDGGNRIITLSYDQNSNMTQKTITAPKNDGSGLTETRTWNYTYNSKGQVLSMTDANNHTTTYVYDTNGNLNTVINALNQTITLDTYNSFNKPTHMTDLNGYNINVAYDSLGNISQINFAGEITQYSYDGENNITKMTRPDGSSLQYVYNAAHNITNLKMYDETNTYIGQAIFTRDTNEQVTQVQYMDDSGNVTHSGSATYNSLSQISQNIGASNEKTQYGYDAQGNPNHTVDPLGNSVDKNFDPLSRVKQIINTNGNPVDLAYDLADNLKTVTDTNSHTTTYTYNGFGNVITEQSPDRGTIHYTYDSMGNVLSKTDARGILSTYSYDNLNRVMTKNVNNAEETLTFTYDSCTNGMGFICSATSSLGGTTNYTYLRNRVASKNYVSGTFNKTVSYGYNSAGQMTSMTYPSGKIINITYTNHQILSLGVKIGSSTTKLINQVVYDPFDGFIGWYWGNNKTYARNYDNDRYIQDIEDSQVSSFSKKFSTDKLGQVQIVFNYSTNAQEQGYGNDSLNQTNLYNNSIAPIVGINYVYDDVGNRQTSTLNPTATTTYNYANNNNQITSLTGATSESFTYDASGNMLTGSGLTMTYNGNGRLASVNNGNYSTGYIYDSFGQRTEKSGSGISTSYFMYDENQHLIGEYNASGTATEETVYLYDTPVGMIDSSNKVDYIHTDYLNTPRLITSSTGTTLWQWKYNEPFGNSLPTASTGFSYNLRFPGQYYDSESGLFYNMNRSYMPNIGRYTQPDPIGLAGGINPYAYVDNNPINAIDMLGLTPENTLVMGPRNSNSEANTHLYSAAQNDTTEKGILAIYAHATSSLIGLSKNSSFTDMLDLTNPHVQNILNKINNDNIGLSPADFAILLLGLKNNYLSRFKGIVIYACYYGRSDSAQKVSNLINMPVTAATEFIVLSDAGNPGVIHVAGYSPLSLFETPLFPHESNDNAKDVMKTFYPNLGK